jgi:hypothetical protein
MITSNYYGNEVTYDENTEKYYYKDTGECISDVDYKPCKLCGKKPTKEGHDACIANLPGVKFACCGHGMNTPYVLFKNGKMKEFNTKEDLLKYFKRI